MNRFTVTVAMDSDDLKQAAELLDRIDLIRALEERAERAEAEVRRLKALTEKAGGAGGVHRPPDADARLDQPPQLLPLRGG